MSHATIEQPQQTDTATVRETAAASLLVIGRLALVEYCERRGRDPVLLHSMLTEAVGAWADAWGCDPHAVEVAQNHFYAQSLGKAKPDVHH